MFRVQWWIELGGRVVNQVNAFFVRELGKYLILKFSLFEISPASIKYLVTCSIVDYVVSPENLVNLGTLHLGGSLFVTHILTVGM